MTMNQDRISRHRKVVIHQDGDQVHEEQVVHDVSLERRQDVYKVSQLIWLLVGSLEGLIAFRMFLQVIAANPNSWFVWLVYRVTDVFVWPFQNIVANPSFDGHILEITSVIAMFAYLLLGLIVVRLIWLLFYRVPTSRVSVYDRDEIEPTVTEEFVIVERMTSALQNVQKVLTTDQLVELQKEVDKVYVDPALMEYAVRMVTATRSPQEVALQELQHYIMFGASPRASINLILTARALAFVRGRTYALPQDVLDMAYDVMRHRVVLSYEALSDNVTADDLLKNILDRIPIPVVPLHERERVRSNS